jgi:hypothetical protein
LDDPGRVLAGVAEPVGRDAQDVAVVEPVDAGCDVGGGGYGGVAAGLGCLDELPGHVVAGPGTVLALLALLA